MPVDAKRTGTGAAFVGLGVLVIWVIGFAQSLGNHESLIHNFSHDARCEIVLFPGASWQRQGNPRHR